jgi:two-component system sensor kinase FixL
VLRLAARYCYDTGTQFGGLILNVLTIVYISSAAIGAVLGLLHLGIWARDRSQLSFLFAAIMSLSAGAVAWLELSMALATTEAGYVYFGSLTAYPICSMLVSMVLFIRVRLDAGRNWLAILISGMWICGILIELLTPEPFMISSATIETRATSWGDTYTVGVLVSPILKSVLLDLPTPLIAIFIVDASLQCFRRGAKRDAIIFGGAAFFFILVAGVHAVLVDTGMVQTPYMISIAFVAISVALAFGLMDDVARAAVLTNSLKSQRLRWRALLEGIQLAAIRTDRNGTIVYLNEFLQELIAQPTQDIMGKSLVQLAPPSTNPEQSDLHNSAEVGTVLPRSEGSILTSKNETRDFVWFNVRLNDEAGEFDGFISLGEDVTEARKVRDELGQTRQELERLSRILTIGELAATLAHELSQPIGAVLSNVQAATKIRTHDPNETGEIDEILGDILRDTRRAAAIMGQIRSFAFNKTVDYEQFDLRRAISEVNDILGFEARANIVKIILDGPEVPVFVNASRIELQQVLLNLGLNSLQALKESGIPSGRITISWRQKEDRVEIFVTDNGPGLSDQDRSEIFKAFSTTKPEGMGIGLAVSHRIIGRHRGTIEASENPDGGALFRLTLPLNTEASSIAAS